MARGALGGFVIGAAVAVVGTAVVSVVTQPTGPQPEADSTAPANNATPQATPNDVQAALPQSGDPVSPNGELAPMETPNTTQTAPVADLDTRSAEVPDTATVQGTLSAPSGEDQPTLAAPIGDAPVATPSLSAAPEIPTSEDTPKALAAPVRPALPDQPETPQLAALPDEGAAPLRPTQGDQAPSEAAVPSAPALKDATGAPSVETTPAPAPVTSDEPDRVPAEIVALPRSNSGTTRPALPKIGQDTTETVQIGTPATRLTDRANTDAAPDTVPNPEAAPLPPLLAHAEIFDNPEDKPLMSIVLIDSGDSPIGLEALASFPYPLSFAIDAASPTAQARMRRYREAGFEVLAMTDMPLGATASDTEALLRAGLLEVPQAVAVMEGPQTGLQSDKAVSDQTAAILQETGHGLVLFPKGLNTAQKLALKSGVPAASVFRDFDSKGQNAAIIRRFLDQAAFKARQEDAGVIMVGRLQAETISALLLWGLQDRANRVALAPVSALLRKLQD